MYFIIAFIIICWLLWKYSVVLISSGLSFATKCKIRVGGVGFFEIRDVVVRLPTGIAVHVDVCSLQRDGAQSSHLFTLRLGDVRIEGEPRALTKNVKKTGNGDGTTKSKVKRLGQIAQYCGVFVNRVHVVMFEVVPECMIHVTADELSIQTFRSRDGWQLETNCRLVQGKALRRRGPSGHLHAEVSFPLRLSLDIVNSRLNKVILRVADPSINLTNGLFDLFTEYVTRQNKEKPAELDEIAIEELLNEEPKLIEVDWQLNVCVKIEGLTLKYTGTSHDESRYMTLSVREFDVSKESDRAQLKLSYFALTDQLLKSQLRTSFLSVAINEIKEIRAFDLHVSSDSVNANLSLHDALWWREHADCVLVQLPQKIEKPSRSFDTSPSQVACIFEVATVSCDLVDFENCHSILSIEFLSLMKRENNWEVGVESLSFCSSQTSATPAKTVFDEHRWGESVYIGVALVQLDTSGVVPLVTVGVDEAKMEWSERFAKQINNLISISESGSPSRQKATKSRSVAVRVTANRLAVISVARQASYFAVVADKVDVDASDINSSIAASAQGIRGIIGHVTSAVLDISRVRDVSRNVSVAPEKPDASPSRRWSKIERDRTFAERRAKAEKDAENGPRLWAHIDAIRFVVDYRSSVVSDIRIFSDVDTLLTWSPLLHLLVQDLRKSIKKALAVVPRNGVQRRKVPRKLHLNLNLTSKVEVELELARSHKMLWRGDTLALSFIEGQLTTSTRKLEVIMNTCCIITAQNVLIRSRPSDENMTLSRKAFSTLHSDTNKVWIWTADLFRFHLPFDFNFAEVFEEFLNMFKWLKVVHDVKKKEFTAKSPLPADICIEFKEAVLELDDDEFENRLQSSFELRQDEVYECERRTQILEERVAAMTKANPLVMKELMAELMRNLTKKNSEIYVERWNLTKFSPRSLFVSRWKGWKMRALADLTLHGTERCVQLIKTFDPLSVFPEEGLQFSTLWARAVEFDLDEWTVSFKDYPVKYLDAQDIHFFGTLVGAETFQEGGRSLRESSIPMRTPWPTYTVQRNMSPLKFYYDLQCASSSFTTNYGPCWEPCLSMVSLTWNNISAPSVDPSPPLPFWDKMRSILHGRLLWSSEKTVTTMMASTDPYNETETVEWCWDDFGLDWALGEIRIKSGLRIFMRTASRYDDSRVLMLPDVRLKITLGWVCSGDPHDHHSIVLCSPQRLPHYSSVEQHDSYRAFRSSAVDVSISFDVSPGSCTSAEKMPNVLLYANTFRCIEQLLKTLTTKNRNVRRGRIFGTPALLKPQLSKHFGNVQISVTLPKVFVTYWMSHSSAFGLRVFSDGLQMTASLRQSVQHSSTNREMNVRRRKVYSWSTRHMTCTWWATEVHVYGQTATPPADGPSEATFLLGFSRVQYARETYPGKETPVHKLTAYDLKMAWTADNRVACLTIADGVHRAHMLRRILSNDAVKILNVHLEEEDSSRHEKAREEKKKEEIGKAHRRGYSTSDANQWMLSQLIDEVSTKLVAHCEQASDVPIDSLLGVQQCTSDDVRLLNWQIDLFNSQLVLKGCQRDGFLLVTAAKAQLMQNLHRGVWRSGLLLSKKSWTALLSGMQYFAPISVTGENKEKFRWLPREVIEEKSQDNGFADDFVQRFSATGEAVGGVVQPEPSSGEKSQLQRIVSRCSCQIYFCYFSDELKTDSSEDIAVPKVEEKASQPTSADEIGVDCLTLKHNMLEATSNSEQYEMVVDIVNNLVLFVDPNKKELAEKRRRMRFESQLMDMPQLRQNIIRYQSDLREIVSLVRYLERQIFYLQQEEQDLQNDETSESDEKRRNIEIEMEEKKQLMQTVSDQLATYISCYKQRQVNASRAEVQQVEQDAVAPLVRRFEVCFEDCIWKLTECDGQIALAQTQIRNFLYTRTIRMENSGEHLFEVGSVRVTNMLPDAVYTHTLHRDDAKHSRQPAIRLFVRDMPPVGGICVKEHFELNIAPMVAEITHRLFDKMMRFFFPGRNIHNQENLEGNGDSENSKFSFTRRIASSLSMRSNKGQNERPVFGKLLESEKDDIDRMRERADQINHFLYIKIPEVSFVVSYKGNKDKNLTDVDKFNFLFPLCEFHEKNWTWLDLALAVKQRCKRVLLQQFMRQKLLRNRLAAAAIEPPPQGVSEEEKKRIAVGNANVVGKKSKK